MIAIDPGASGAIAWTNAAAKGGVSTIGMPDALEHIASVLEQLEDNEVYLENVGGYRPGNSGPAACKFARHCGHLEAICYCQGSSVIKVAPRTWQKALGGWSKDKAERKREIKKAMQKKYPHVKVTLGNADALGILTWALEKREEKHEQL